MSLLSFHRALIAVAIVFCGGYAGRELARGFGGGGVGHFVLGGVFAILTVGLVYYLARLRRFLGYDRQEPSRP